MYNQFCYVAICTSYYKPLTSYPWYKYNEYKYAIISYKLKT